VVEAAQRLPDILFVLVGSYGNGVIEASAAGIENILVIPWQPADVIGQYVLAADVLLVPPSWKPLAQFGSTVLPLKLFFYMASGRPILAGNTPDVSEVLQHDRNAFLCRPDNPDSLVDGLRILTIDTVLADRIAATALADSADFTWDKRTSRIVDIIRNRLEAPPVTGSWSGAHTRIWRHQSWRWLKNLLRTRSLVLPPSFEPDVISRSEVTTLRA
jgi:glycosyltransferase involved in cell wall biosynthesis